MFNDSVISNYIQELIKETCKSTGCVCEKWVDDEIYMVYKKTDKEKGEHQAHEYLMQCHSPIISAKPSHANKKEWEFELKCRGPIRNNEKCNFSNEEARLILEKEFLSHYQEKEKEID